MTQGRRIVLNVVATYGRSLYALALGLFCGRWLFMSLGEVDYGLVGLVGGLTGVVSFVSGLIADAVGRFYSVSVGAARKKHAEIIGLEECRRWFNTALSIHSVMSVVLVVVGYPAGLWAVRTFLNIPVERIESCVWVWRFVCISCFTGMFCVPFSAMYGAKQEIAELTVYSFITSTLNVLFLYFMITHPGDWLARYALWSSLLVVLPKLIISVNAVRKYPECRFNRNYLFEWDRIKQLFSYSFARFLSPLAGMVSGQGSAIMINKFLGAQFNAAASLGNMVAGHAQTLSGALSGAFWPALANLVGEGRFDKAREYCFMVCRFGSLLVLVFAIPLMIEIHEVLHIWLGAPPAFAAEVCVFILLQSSVERMTEGYWMVILGCGKGVFRYSFFISFTGFGSLITMSLLLIAGFGMWSVCLASLVPMVITIIVRLYYVRVLHGYSPWSWMTKVFMPIMTTSCLSAAAGFALHLVMPPSFLRVVITTLICEAVFLPLVWFVVLNSAERNQIVCRVGGLFGKTLS